MPARINIFNQYYFSFLKKVKDSARELKHKNLTKDSNATYAKVLKAIKSHYASYDTSSEFYHNYFTQNDLVTSMVESWYTNIHTYSDIALWIQNENVQNAVVYQDISIGQILEVADSPELVYYNLAVLFIFSQDISDNELPVIIEFIKNIKSGNTETLTIDNIKTHKTLEILKEIHDKAMTSSVESTFKHLEDTSLGKLAKEIMGDINLEDIQSSLQNEGDILKSLSNPEGGLTKLLGSVSQKMISKLASGEIQQETLLKDAMAFSSQLTNIIPNNKSGGGGMPDMGGLGNMFEQLQKMTSQMGGGGAGAGGGLGNLQEMMAALSGGNMGERPPQNARPQTRADNHSMSRLIKAKQLRSKLEKRKSKTKENVQTHVEDE